MTTMKDLKACVACLNTGVKLLDIDEHGLRKDFNILIGLHTERGNGLPNYLCLECDARIAGFKKFRTKYRQAYFMLIEILERKTWILLRDIKNINRKAAGLLSTLSHWSAERAHYEFVIFDEIQHQDILNKSEVAYLPVYNVISDNNQCLSHDPLKNESISKRNTNESELVITKTESTLAYVDSNNTMEDEPQCEIQEAKDTIESDISMNEDEAYSFDSDVDGDCTDDINNDCIKEYKQDNTNLNEKNVKSVSLTTEKQSVDQVVSLDSDSDKVFSDEDDFDRNDYNNDVAKETESYDSEFDEEYARLIPLTTKEQAAAVEVFKLFSNKKYKCEICSKSFNNEEELKLHKRMHDKHEKGNFECELCNYYYRTESLLQTHITDKHMYKYKCKKCPEVSFDRLTAKIHFLRTHLKHIYSVPAEQSISRPNWLRKRNVRKSKGITTNKITTKLPDDYYITLNIDQLEQYEIIKERKKSVNFLKSRFKCELCYRGFGNPSAYEKHLKRHDPEVSGKLVCDMCKLCFRDARKMYHHVKAMHLYKYCCQLCANVCYNSHQAKLHYHWHKNVQYPCPHCDKKFSKMSTLLTHRRLAHPSTKLCSICGHSFISDMGLRFHINRNHTKEEIDVTEKNKELETVENKLYCSDCKIVFLSDEAFKTHLGSSSNHTNFNKSASVRPYKAEGRRGRISTTNEIVNVGQVTTSTCTECGEELPSDAQARKHYKSKHPGVALPKRYMCDVCGYTSYLYANLQVHIFQRHTNEKPHACPICDRRFSVVGSRDRHLNVHTGERRYECKLCHRRFAQKSGVKIHIQTVHMKIPYPPWQKKNRKRSKDAGAPLVEQQPPPVPEAHTNYLDAYSAQLF